MIRVLRAVRIHSQYIAIVNSLRIWNYNSIVPIFPSRGVGTSVDRVNNVSVSKSNIGKASKWNIEATCPELIKYWHSSKNVDIKPDMLSIKSAGKIWWKCGKGPDHEWRASPRHMLEIYNNKEELCPFCSNRKVSIANSLATLYPEISSQWDTSKNGELSPSKVLPTSSLSVWWRCEKGENHSWKRVIHHRTHPRSSVEGKCPFCCGVDIQSKSLAVCRPDLAAEWDYERNGHLTPEHIPKSSSKRVWWICPNGHRYQSTVYNRGSTHNTSCPICSGRKVTDSTKLSGNHHLMEFLDLERNQGIDVNKTSVLSKRQLFWRCPESLFDDKKQHHRWKCSIHDMASLYNYECPFCSNLLFVKSVDGDEIQVDESRNNNNEIVIWNDYGRNAINCSQKSQHRMGINHCDFPHSVGSSGVNRSKPRKWKEGRVRRHTLDDLDLILASLSDEWNESF